MSFPSQNPLKLALDELRSVLIRCQSDNVEALKLVREIETIVQNIENKTRAQRFAQEIKASAANAQMPGVVVPASVNTVNVLA